VSLVWLPWSSWTRHWTNTAANAASSPEHVEICRQAGRHALEQQAASGWWQLYIQFTDWN
jgi:hypothetical protein